LNLIVGHILMERYPSLKEGDLSRMRSNLVNELQLANMARDIDLGSFIMLGKGEIQTNGREKDSILANTFEAVIAAVYLDGGFQAAFKIIENKFNTPVDSISASYADTDYKSRLQELVQLRHKEMPDYKIVEETGPDHAKIFKVQVKIQELAAEGTGRNKKSAEQDSARNALEILRKQDSEA